MIQNSKNILLAAFAFFSIAGFSIALYLFFTKPRIAYVYNSRVLSEYKGVKESKINYDKKVQLWQSNLDTLSRNFNQEIFLYQQEQKKLSAEEKKAREDLLRRREQELINYKAAIENKAKEEETEMTSAVLNQINNYILEYGKKSEYDYILGVTDNGSLLYGREGDDITEIVITKINEKYAGNK